jgi:hypothetical protein
MRKLLGLGALLALLIAGSAGKPIPTGTIDAPIGDVRYLGVIEFPYTFNVNGKAQARIAVECFQDGESVYQMHINPDPETNIEGTYPYVLGGGTSRWWLNGGGEADCTAELFYWKFHPDYAYVPLDSVEFHAEA